MLFSRLSALLTAPRVSPRPATRPRLRLSAAAGASGAGPRSRRTTAAGGNMSGELKVLTFNISAGNVSQSGPSNFNLSQKYEAILDLILEEQPDLVSLQELDELAAAQIVSGLEPAGYEKLGAAESHCNFTVLFVRSALQARRLPAAGPAPIAQIPLPLPDGSGSGPGAAGTSLYFVGCHLEPFGEGAPKRLAQIERVLRCLPPRCRLVMAGDFNMRVSENSKVEGLGLADAFVQVGSPRDQAWTWNSNINKYYGADQRAYNARYDRVYLRGLQATDMRLIANRPLTLGGADFLSDHFGLACSLRLTEQQPSPLHLQQQPPSRAQQQDVQPRRLFDAAGAVNEVANETTTVAGAAAEVVDLVDSEDSDAS